MQFSFDNAAFERDFNTSDEAVEMVDAVLDRIAEYWQTHSRRDTGRMANDFTTTVHRRGATRPPEGEFEVKAPYVVYQELGTRYLDGQFLLEEILTLLDSGAL
ncbi:hypothetical protein SEA_OBLADI_11 [Gordonia phage ObLaDi]|uniref:Uncharacterized protein n=4 Tax=Cafassovirus TaxID=3425056 RepID=A0A9E7QC77_9CAUD|nr:hypothetical protein SEA_CAFASSO_11 [Gordonia phage Cafasso]UVK59751.1 hypothetical protein SEA_ALEEMILY_11 [Gordonia phage Aleemily]UXE03734.1 hypothetical protein SEA_OBLADI_11 [Gordonia phage ObLaDi]